MFDPWLLVAALVVEACVGYPHAIYRAIRHPVVWIGVALAALERRLNRPELGDLTRRMLGVVTVVIVTGGAAGVGYLVQRLAGGVSFGAALVALVASTGLAQHSLYTHVRAVLLPLTDGDLVAARREVAQIVGRDTASLNESDVAGAALESLAESFNDGIVAPAFWLFVGGLPGLFAYKALNTADSLIGHREPRWRMFGWFAARTDDLVNLIPARLAGALLAIAGGGGLLVMWRDAPKHASPNAGWPEAAMAGALRIRLGGPTAYDGVMHERPIFGAGSSPTVDDLKRGLRIYVIACGLLWLAALAVGFAMGTND
ncbi:adenosylcobinamide-phosphate synthase CbiB [Peristeroidobacter soli]|jgi:adenosylcobinamide-phosphate synthase|uniref:adenosylcobinamide-phosphate synthase CbiB n=1 Tax=Peristeroidobacter soli TaxID=2497877 RepID=UPI00101C55A7|nr:adenosylcobinamide-phosphate synthase CbiB [Peristeroidobacter soli]